VHFLGCRMGRQRSQRFEDQPTLPGHSASGSMDAGARPLEKSVHGGPLFANYLQ
jgi:hypothetical protein